MWSPLAGLDPANPEREPMKFRLLALTSIAVVTLAGCGGNGFDTAKANATIKSDLAKVTDQGVPVEVNCPGDVDYVQNGKFTCTGSVNGAAISYTVSMGASKDVFTYVPSAAVITLDKAKKPILERFAQVARTTWVMDCGPTTKDVLVVPVGTIFECSVVGRYNQKTFRDAVRITVLDPSGNIDWKPFSPSASFVPRQILPKSTSTPSPSPSTSQGGIGNVPSEQFITPELVTPTPSVSTK